MDRFLPESLQRAVAYVGESAPLRPAGTVIRWSWVYYRNLGKHAAFSRAGSMAYMTLIALVPLLVVVFGVLGAVGGHGGGLALVEALLHRVIGVVPDVEDWLRPVLEAVDLKALGLVAIASFLVVGWQLYAMVERSYNEIFGTAVRRELGHRFLTFYVTVTLVPIALVFLLQATVDFAAGFGVSGSRELLALAMQFLALAAALRLLPCTRVDWGPVLLGSTVSLALLEGGRRGFSLYVSWFAGADAPMRALYGSLTVIPLFLFWLYLQWIFVLLGVEVANTAQNFPSLLAAEREAASVRSRFPKVDDALLVAAWVARRHADAQGPTPAAALQELTHLDHAILAPILDALVDARVLVRADEGFTLRAPADQTPLRQIVAAWRAATGRGSAGQEGVTAEIDARLALEGSLADGVARWLPAPGGVTPGPSPPDR